jgi:hypothetical protein
MSLGQGLGQGLMLGAQLVNQNRRADKDQKRQLEMFNLKRAADIEDMQKQNELRRQQALQEQADLQNNNLNAGQAILALTGQKAPEGFDNNQLRYVAPTVLNSTLDDVRNTATKKEQAELKKQQAKISNQIYKNVLNGGPLDPDVLSQAEELGVDTSKAFGLYQNREDKKELQEDRQAAAIQLKQIAASLRPSKVGGGGGHGRSGGGHGRGGGTSGGGKPMKRFNPETNSYDFYDPKTGQPVGRASRPAPVFNYSPQLPKR